jgi:hypothetical protein
MSEQLNEIKKDVNQKLWNVYRIPSNIGANGYTISSNFDETNVLNSIIAFSKNKWKEGNTVVSTEDEDGSGYLFKYIIYLINKTVKDNPRIASTKMRFTQEIANNFGPVEKVNDEPLTKADAEMLKRNEAKRDINSFKRKGAAIFREFEKAGIDKKSLSKLTKNFQETIFDLFKWDELQYYAEDDGLLLYHKGAFEKLMDTNLPDSLKADLESVENNPENAIDPETGKKFPYKLKMIPKDSKIYRTITGISGFAPKKIIKQKF